MGVDKPEAWIFVSHASDDLPRVREVRNYLESKGAAPLLFHLRALAKAEEFWPLIEREIQARNFFLYCESEVAETREWVIRERAAVEQAGRERPIRVGSIRVDADELLLSGLDAFLAKTRVFYSYASADRAAVQPLTDALARRGFQQAEIPFTASGDWKRQAEKAIRDAAAHGWVIVFLSQASLQSPWVEHEIRAGLGLGAKFVAVALEPITLPPQLRQVQLPVFDAWSHPASAPDRLATLMLRR